MFRFLILSILLCFLQGIALGQNQHCGTEYDVEQVEQTAQFLKKNRKWMGLRSRSIVKVPTTIHIIRKSDGTGGSDILNVIREINIANEYFKNAGMEFFQCGLVNYINDDANYNIDKSNILAFTTANSVPNTVNMYFSNELWNGPYSLCGTSSAGSNFLAPYLFVNKACMEGVTLPHELGHDFRLLHTHETFGGIEYVDGSNCSSAGDYLCSTPADPRLAYTNVDSNTCEFSEVWKDPKGNIYAPNTRNMMSYSWEHCTDHFTSEQYDVMTLSLATDYPNLNCNSYDCEHILPKPQILSSDTIIIRGESLSLSVSGLSNYFWSTGESGSQISVQPGETTIYTVSNVFGNCTGPADSIRVKVIDKGLSIYPNPNSGTFRAQFFLEEQGNVDIRVFNLLGELVHRDIFSGEKGIFEEEILLNPKIKGYFILQIKTDSFSLQEKLWVR